MKKGIAVCIAALITNCASAIDFSQIPEGGVGVTLNNTSPYTVVINSNFGPGGLVMPITLAPREKKELYLDSWSSPNGLSVYVETYYIKKQSKRWIDIRAIGGKGVLNVTVVRVSPGLIRVLEGIPAR